MTIAESIQSSVFAKIRQPRFTLLTAAIAVTAGLVVLILAYDLFPYHSTNHDEGVYLLQAAMLTEGRLVLTPGSEALRQAFHPWFFVESPHGLYPKYSPVPAAVFALGMIVGDPRLALFGIAVCNVAIISAITAEAFDQKTGILAAAIVAASPLFLLPSAAFLPYAPTTALNLLFALAYIRSVRAANPWYAGVAGIAIGLAFFARPYTAVIFAIPFMAYAGWQLLHPRARNWRVIRRTGITAGIGVAFVGLTLFYNHLVTGSAFLFPYEAFAPLDGIGFGRRRILGHETQYTPTLALRSNGRVLWALATRWFTAGPIGTTLAAIGVTSVVVYTKRTGLTRSLSLGNRTLQLLLAGLAGTIIAGNVYFWGNYNMLGSLSDPNDGMITLFGPFYHFDLLLPLSAFAAHGTLVTTTFVWRAVDRLVSSEAPRIAAVLLLAVALPVTGAVDVWAVSQPMEKHSAHTAKYERAYTPFVETDLEHALVFIPPTYGEFQNHPFQWLRNDPGFDGEIVYAITRNPSDDFAVIDAYPDREYYRYRYHGEWTPDPNRHVDSTLEHVRVIESDSVTAQTTVAVPDRIVRVALSVTTGDSVRRFNYRGQPPDALTITWTITNETVTVTDQAVIPREGDPDRSIQMSGPSDIALAVTITEPDGGTLTYREELLVRPTDTGIQAVWPPASSVCIAVTDCGFEGTYLRDRPDTRPDGIQLNTTRVTPLPTD